MEIVVVERRGKFDVQLVEDNREPVKTWKRLPAATCVHIVDGLRRKGNDLADYDIFAHALKEGTNA